MFIEVHESNIVIKESKIIQLIEILNETTYVVFHFNVEI